MARKHIKTSWDYIIVGAGSAGCVLARRLSDDPNNSVLVLEAGGPAPSWDWRIHMPAAFAYAIESNRYNWGYQTVPQTHLANRRIEIPRGRAIGGSSTINGMAYVRGHAQDYDRWAQDPVLHHWSYQHCLPYFRRAEKRDLGANDYHGKDGPLYVTTGKGWSPLYKAFIEAGKQAGYPYTADMNGYQQEGFGPMQMTIRDGIRCSTARGYLAPVKNRPNLEIRSHAVSHRIVFDGQRACAIEYGHKGKTHTVYADQCIIIAAGAIGSPQLLMLSGIGPADHLRAQGINARVDLPGVGSNYQDHLELYLQQRCKKPVTLYPETKLWRKASIGLQWYLSHTGHGASNHFESGGFIRSRPDVGHPDLQFHFAPLAVHADATPMVNEHSFQAQVGPMRPKSRGTVRLNSTNPYNPPLIDPLYMSHADDWRDMRAAIRLARNIFKQNALASYSSGEISPGSEIQTDEELDHFIATSAHTSFHPSCTCAMGSGSGSVVDGNAAVYGTQGLHVVDASIMPTIVSGNLNAPTIMIAEKAADLIMGRKPLPPANVAVYAPPSQSSEANSSKEKLS